MALDPAGRLLILGNRENMRRTLTKLRSEVDAALGDIDAMEADPMRPPLLS